MNQHQNSHFVISLCGCDHCFSQCQVRRAKCNPEERICSRQRRKRRRVCFTSRDTINTKTASTTNTNTIPKVAHIDEKRRKQGGRIVQTQMSSSSYTVDLTRPSLVSFASRPSTPFVIDLTYWTLFLYPNNCSLISNAAQMQKAIWMARMQSCPLTN